MSARRRVTDAFGVGIEGSTGLVKYSEHVNNDATSWSAGAFTDATLSELRWRSLPDEVQN